MITISELIVGFGWLSLSILLFAIIYRRILKRMQRERLEKELYFILHPIEKNPASGVVSIFLEMYTAMDIEVSIYSNEKNIYKVLENKRFKKGGNIVQLDTTQLPDGVYFYQAKNENQNTKKILEIIN